MTPAQYAARWRKRNPDYVHDYYRKNKKRLRAMARLYYEKTKAEYLKNAAGEKRTPAAIKSEEWRKKHPDYKKQWYRKHRAQMLRESRRYYRKNPKKCMTATMRWRDSNRKKWCAYVRKLRADNIEYYRAKSKRLYWANREKRLLAHRRWREANPGWHRDYVAKNRERIKAWFKEWVKTNKNVKKKQAIGQKIRYGALDGGWLHSKWLKVGKLCYICGKALRRCDISIDHVFPASKGGSHAQSNLMPVHRRCNCKKANKIDFPAVRPDLIRKAA